MKSEWLPTMPLHVAIWSQIVMESELSWADQGKVIRLLSNAWSRGDVGARPQWAGDVAWATFERLWPELLIARQEHEAKHRVASEKGRLGNLARWGKGESPSDPPAIPERSPSDPKAIAPNPNPNPNPNPDPKQKPETKTLEILPPDKPAAPRETWITPYCEAWAERTGGEMVVKPALKPLAKLRDKHGDSVVLDAWADYLAETPVEFCSAIQFAAKFGQWNRSAAPPEAREYRMARELAAEGRVKDIFAGKVRVVK